MPVLLTNDDGINAEGLQKLKSLVQSLGFDESEIWIVAPKHDRSATSHAVTLKQPILFEKVSNQAFAVDGTPTDCVIVAMNKLFSGSKKPDFVFSGVNIGANVGIDKIYSGTVGAAMEGFFFEVPSFSISQLYYDSKDNIKWNTDSKVLVEIIKKIIQKKDKFLKQSMMSINLPHNDIKGVRFIKQGEHKMSNVVDHHINEITESKDPQYIIINATNKIISCDSLNEGYITITPVGSDLTDHNILDQLNKEFS